MMRQSEKTRRGRPLGQRGITLVELMIALVLTAIIGGALYQGLISQTKNFVLQDQLAEAQQNGRLAMDAVIKDLRMAGYGMSYVIGQTTFNDQAILLGSVTLPNGTAVVTNNNASQGTTDAVAIRRGDSTPYSIIHFNNHPHHGDWWQVFIDIDPDTITQIPIKKNDLVLLKSVTMGSPSRNEFCSMKVMEKGRSDTDWHAGDPLKKWKLAVAAYSGQFASTNGLTANYTGGTATKLLEVAYYIDTSSGVNVLMKAMNDSPSQIAARYIEDLQVAYQDSANLWYRTPSGQANDPPTPNNIRSMRVNLLARARLPGSKNLYSVSALEDGLKHPLTGTDPYARRWLTSQIKVRNYGID